MKRIAVAVALVVMGGCTGTTVEPLYEQSPTEPYNVVAIGRFSDPWGYQSGTNEFRRGLVWDLRRSKAFAEVIDPAPIPLPASALLLTAAMAEPKRGGLCQDHIFGTVCPFYAGATVELRDSTGDLFTSFKLRVHGYGRAVLSKLAGETSAAIVRWSQGEGLSR